MTQKLACFRKQTKINFNEAQLIKKFWIYLRGVCELMLNGKRIVSCPYKLYQLTREKVMPTISMRKCFICFD